MQARYTAALRAVALETVASSVPDAVLAVWFSFDFERFTEEGA